MAESQIAGLFMTPEMYRRQQMEAADQQAINFARLSPREQASYGFYSAGQGLGQLAGSLLGAQDPQLQRITEQQRLLQGLDVADPDSLMQAARQASQAGNVPLAMQLAQQANQAAQAKDVAMQRQLQMNALRETAAERERAQARATQAAQLGARALEQSQTMYGAPAPVIRDDEGNLMPGAGVTSRYNITPEIAAGLSATPEGRSVLEGLLAGQKATRPERIVIDNVPYIVDDSTGQLSEAPGFVPKQKEPPKPTAKVQEYNFAVQQGFAGTFQDWIDRNARIGAPRVSVGGGGGRQTPAQTRAEARVSEGREQLRSEIDSILESYSALNEIGGMTDPSRGTLSNVYAWARSLPPGQVVGSAIGSQEQTLRDNISNARARLTNAIKEATGMSAQQMNSNVELQLWLKSVTDPTQSYSTVVKTLGDLDRIIGRNMRDAGTGRGASGSWATGATPAATPTAAPAGGRSSGRQAPAANDPLGIRK